MLSTLPHVSVQASSRSGLGSGGCEQQQKQREDMLVQILSREDGSGGVIADTARQLALSQGKSRRGCVYVYIERERENLWESGVQCNERSLPLSELLLSVLS